MTAERPVGLHGDVHARSAGHVVDDHRNVYRVRDGRVVRHKALLRALVVIGSDHEQRACADRRGNTAHFQAMSRVVASGAGDDLTAAGGILNGMIFTTEWL